MNTVKFATIRSMKRSTKHFDTLTIDEIKKSVFQDFLNAIESRTAFWNNEVDDKVWKS